MCLDELALTRQDWPGLEEVIARLTALTPVAREADVFRARANLVRGNPAEALARDGVGDIQGISRQSR